MRKKRERTTLCAIKTGERSSEATKQRHWRWPLSFVVGLGDTCPRGDTNFSQLGDDFVRKLFFFFENVTTSVPLNQLFRSENSRYFHSGHPSQKIYGNADNYYTKYSCSEFVRTPQWAKLWEGCNELSGCAACCHTRSCSQLSCRG